MVTRLQRMAQSSGPKFDALRGGFQWGPAGEMLQRIVTQEAQIGRIRPGGKFRGRIVRSAHHSCRGHGVHGRNIRRFQRRLAAKHLLRLVCTSIGNYQGEFHARIQGSEVRVQNFRLWNFRNGTFTNHSFTDHFLKSTSRIRKQFHV